MKASITRLNTRLAELETKVHEPSTLSHAHKLSAKLESLDSEFKVHNYGIIDTILDDDHVGETMTKEQDELDQHDTNIANLSICLEELMRKSSPKAESAAYKIASHNLASLRDRLTVISSALTKLSGASEEIHLVEQYQEQVSGLKRELSDTRRNVIIMHS